MTESSGPSTPPDDHRFHTYRTHRIPWYVRAMWICFWIGAVWYIIKFAIPMAKSFYR